MPSSLVAASPTAEWDGGLVGDVALDGERSGPGLGGDLIEPVLATGQQCDAGTVAGEMRSRCSVRAHSMRPTTTAFIPEPPHVSRANAATRHDLKVSSCSPCGEL